MAPKTLQERHDITLSCLVLVVICASHAAHDMTCAPSIYMCGGLLSDRA